MDLFDLLYQFALQFQYFGVFIVSFIGALSIIFPIPYTLVIYFLGGFLNPFFVALSGGLGSALGEFSGYALGYYGRNLISEERRKKMEYMVCLFRKYGFFAIFLFALTPLPDDLLFIPLGIMGYSFLKAFIPALIGKTLMCFILAYTGSLSIKFIRDLLGGGGWLEALLTALLLTILIVAILKIDWEKLFKKYVREENMKEL